MNPTTTFCASVLIAATTSITGAHADDSTPTTRSQVIAELHAARMGGTLAVMQGEDSGSFWLARQPLPSNPGRRWLQAKTVAETGTGPCASMLGEDSGSMCLSAQPYVAHRTRAEVLAEVRLARESGELAALFGEDSGSLAQPLRRQPPGLRYAGPNIGEHRAASADPIAELG